MLRLFFLCLLSACTLTSKPIQKTALGQTVSEQAMLDALQNPKPIRFHKIIAADWTIDRRGLIDLKNPKAEAAGLQDGDEAIQIYAYVIHHPDQGRFLVDSGVNQQLKDDFKNSPLGGFAGRFVNAGSMKIRQTLKEAVAENPADVKGVFFTHMHADHILGVPDLPESTQLYAGPGEASHKHFRNAFTRFLTDSFIKGDRRIQELEFPEEKHSILDIFGDGSFFAIWVPGHTKGSLAFVVNGSEGTQLLAGDTCHTRWGWENSVPPGLFSAHQADNQRSLDYLKSLAAKMPGAQVHLGHQL